MKSSNILTDHQKVLTKNKIEKKKQDFKEFKIHRLPQTILIHGCRQILVIVTVTKGINESYEVI